MIKFAIVLVVIYLLAKFFVKGYINGLKPLDKIRFAAKSYTRNEVIALLCFCLLRISTYICIAISVIMTAFKYL